jgi:hypothetical protein
LAALYGCTSNAPTSHKQNGDPRSDPKAAVFGVGPVQNEPGWPVLALDSGWCAVFGNARDAKFSRKICASDLSATFRKALVIQLLGLLPTPLFTG